MLKTLGSSSLDTDLSNNITPSQSQSRATVPLMNITNIFSLMAFRIFPGSVSYLTMYILSSGTGPEILRHSGIISLASHTVRQSRGFFNCTYLGFQPCHESYIELIELHEIFVLQCCSVAVNNLSTILCGHILYFVKQANGASPDQYCSTLLS